MGNSLSEWCGQGTSNENDYEANQRRTNQYGNQQAGGFYDPNNRAPQNYPTASHGGYQTGAQGNWGQWNQFQGQQPPNNYPYPNPNQGNHFQPQQHPQQNGFQGFNQGNYSGQNDLSSHSAGNQSYAICVSNSTASAWADVINALLQKHANRQPKVYKYNSDLMEVLDSLKRDLPYYTCFVGNDNEVSREHLDKVHTISRSLLPGPYSDTIWAILTGPDKETALRIANTTQPLVVERSVSNTAVSINKVQEGIMMNEGKQFLCERKTRGEEKKVVGQCGGDLSEELLSMLTPKAGQHPVDMVVTSSHASEHNWQIGYAFEGGYFVHDKGSNMLAKTVGGGSIPIKSPNPKILIAAGNCLMGHIVPGSCMACSWLKSVGVTQMVGYTKESWFGYGGWGTLKYFVEVAGIHNLSQAFFANIQTLIQQLQMPNQPAQFKKGLEYDNKVLAFYGDPAWEARIPLPSAQTNTTPNPYEQQFTQEGNGRYRLRVNCVRDCAWTCPKANDSSTKPGRPPFFIFPKRMKNPRVTSGKIVLTSLFAIVEVPDKSPAGTVFEATFEEQL